MVVLDEVGPHCLSRVWPRIEATARTKIVVVVMQEQTLAKPRPRQYYQDRFPHNKNIRTVEVGFFPPGTLAFGHACGWPDSSARTHTHSWSCKDGTCLVPPAYPSTPGLRRHPALLNCRDVRMLLIGPSAHVALAAQKVTPEALRRLAFLVGGTGGTGMPSARWGPTWYGAGGGGVRLDWELQTSCTHLDFAIPWRYISWQADSADAHHDLPLGSMNANDLPIAKKHQTQLRALASLPHDEQVPDGAVPCALAPLLGLLGMDANDRTTCIHQLTWAILRAVANGFELHKAHTVHHWQLVGVPLLGLGSHQHQDLAECHACQQSCRALFRIKPQDGQAESDIIDKLCSNTWDPGLDSQYTDTARRLMRQHFVWEGASVCFLCAAPVVAAKYVRKNHARNSS